MMYNDKDELSSHDKVSIEKGHTGDATAHAAGASTRFMRLASFC